MKKETSDIRIKPILVGRLGRCPTSLFHRWLSWRYLRALPGGADRLYRQKLRQNPNWNINIEIEPESWEVVRQRDPEGYEAFKRHLRINPWRVGGSST